MTAESGHYAFTVLLRLKAGQSMDTATATSGRGLDLFPAFEARITITVASAANPTPTMTAIIMLTSVSRTYPAVAVSSSEVSCGFAWDERCECVDVPLRQNAEPRRRTANGERRTENGQSSERGERTFVRTKNDARQPPTS
jgi:hypothetical protein